eukprot:8905262-Pyramimonas_sp.AAC.1
MDWFDATTVAPDVGTCAPAGRRIDFFLVSGGLEAQGAQVHPEMPLSPHSAGCLKISATVGMPKMRVMPVPRLFPDERPIGCSRMDSSSMWAAIRQIMPTGQVSQELLSKGWEAFVSAAERQWVDVFQ